LCFFLQVLCPSSNESEAQDTAHFETTDTAMGAWTKRSDMRVQSSDPETCNDMIQPVIFERRYIRLCSFLSLSFKGERMRAAWAVPVSI
jgi:hypothetical protein